jgi:hypothetical protein
MTSCDLMPISWEYAPSRFEYPRFGRTRGGEGLFFAQYFLKSRMDTHHVLYSVMVRQQMLFRDAP